MHPRWVSADRHPSLRHSAVPLRVCADVSAWRRRGLSLRALGGICGLRSRRLLHSFAHFGADDGELPDARAAQAFCRVAAEAIAKSAQTLPARVRTGLYLGPRPLPLFPLARARTFQDVHHRVLGLCLGFFRPLSVPGREFLPVDRFRANPYACAGPAGTRIKETARLFNLVEGTIRQKISSNQLDNIDLPYGGINMAYQNTGTIGPEDGDMLISLKPNHGPIAAITGHTLKSVKTILGKYWTRTRTQAANAVAKLEAFRGKSGT